MDSRWYKRALGLGEPFATKCRPVLLFGLIAFGIYRLTLPMIQDMFSSSNQVNYWTLINYGPSALLLLAMFFVHKRCCHPDIRFVGKVSAKLVLQGVLAVTALYLISYATALWLGQPREPTMIWLYFFKTPMQNAVMLISLLILPPIVEELTFRHFLLSILPFKKNAWIAAIAIIATATFFAVQHSHYKYLTTYLLLFAVGVVLAQMRIRSNGMALPIGLHAYAVAFALVCDQVVMRFET